MAEHDPLVFSYVHRHELPRAGEALRTLKRVASLVKPIMRDHGWKVKELAEFYPVQENLLGLNVNRGWKICLRLRYASDQNQFLPMENVVDTMLHELCHIVHGPHDQKFHALWDRLRDEWQALLFKGYTGEGFLSEGHRLGGAGRPPPAREVQRLARAAAEKRASQSSPGLGSGRRLGGGAGPSRGAAAAAAAPPRPGGQSGGLRQAAAAAAEKRRKALEGCATERLSDGEIRDMADAATRNGFHTQAEEDEANDLAIARAIWEMAQEDEMVKYGGVSNVRPPWLAEKPMGGVGREELGILLGEARASRAATTNREEPPRAWACSVCTLHNPPSFLCCDACGTERTEAALPEKPKQQQQQQASQLAMIDLTGSPPKKRMKKKGGRVVSAAAPSAPSPPPPPPPPQTWRCGFCETEMERQWWICSTCGQMKTDSR